MVGGHPLSCHQTQSSHAQELSSKTSLKPKGVTGDPKVVQVRDEFNARVGSSDLDSDLEFQDSREEAPLSLAASTAVLRSAPTSSTTISFPEVTILDFPQSHASQNPELMPPAVQSQQGDDSSGDYNAIPMGDLLEDAKFYQNAALEYQNAFETPLTAGRVAD